MIISALIDAALGTAGRVLGGVGGFGKTVVDLIAPHGRLLATQAENLKLKDENTLLKARILDLEKAVARESAFDRDKEKYRLEQVGPGAFAYASKPDAGGEEPPHHLCVPCFDDRKKSILQAAAPQPGANILKCPRCGAEIRTPLPPPTTVYVSSGRRRHIIPGFNDKY